MSQVMAEKTVKIFGNQTLVFYMTNWQTDISGKNNKFVIWLQKSAFIPYKSMMTNNSTKLVLPFPV